jgi:L,D-transpeptidase YbiS
MTEPTWGTGPGFDDEPEPRRSRLRLTVVPRLGRGRWVVLAVASVLLLAMFGVAAGTGYRYAPLSPTDFAAPESAPAAGDAAKTAGRALAERRKLLGSLERAAPRGRYIVVDRTNNRLWLMRDGKVERAAICSAGSGSVLKDEAGGRTWIFDTPRGSFRVRSKLENPVWRKPDWAFIEEGEPVPTDPDDRIEYGVLGEYGLYFGDGFLIHGTLYERLLGRNVTHGCVRLGREDLRAVYKAAPVGTPIYIY